MTSIARLSLSALAGFGLLASLTITPTPAAADGAQYCIATSGANGSGSYVGNCVYTTFEQCLAAVATLRGNCVGNVEYHGGSAAEPAPRRARRAR